MSNELFTELESFFHASGKQEAWKFLLHFTDYIEGVDDLVDEPKNIELVNKVAAKAMALYSSSYWGENKRELYLVARLIHFTYFDIVEWELSDEIWKKQHAKVLSHCGYNMLLAILLHEFGDFAYQRFSVQIREHAHLKHLNDPI